MSSARPDLAPTGPADTLITDATGAQRLVGWVTDVGHPGGARLTLTVGPQHGNRHGVLHGGIIAMLLDSASGYTGSRHIDPDSLPEMLTLSLTTQFLAPALAGTTVHATGKVTGGGRRTLFIDGALRDEDGQLLATSTGVYKPVRQDKT